MWQNPVTAQYLVISISGTFLTFFRGDGLQKLLRNRNGLQIIKGQNKVENFLSSGTPNNEGVKAVSTKPVGFPIRFIP